MTKNDDSIDNYREVTASEKDKLEKEGAAWKRPPQVFIDLWNAACGKWGCYNEATGYFELNGLTDITYEEALAIYNAHIDRPSLNNKYEGITIRTNIPIYWNKNPMWSYLFDATLVGTFTRANIDVIVIGDVRVRFSTLAFHHTICSKVLNVKLAANAYISDVNIIEGFSPLYLGLKLKEPYTTDGIIKLVHAGRLTLECWKDIINDSVIHKGTITFILHNNIYAKLTGDTSNDAYNNLTDEEKAQWATLLPQAQAKNIVFATT